MAGFLTLFFKNERENKINWHDYQNHIHHQHKFKKKNIQIVKMAVHLTSHEITNSMLKPNNREQLKKNFRKKNS